MSRTFADHAYDFPPKEKKSFGENVLEFIDIPSFPFSISERNLLYMFIVEISSLNLFYFCYTRNISYRSLWQKMV